MHIQRSVLHDREGETVRDSFIEQVTAQMVKLLKPGAWSAVWVYCVEKEPRHHAPLLFQEH